jgi:site-specific DNA recombinase
MVTTLERAPRKAPAIARAAIYIRVSSDRQKDGASLEVQLDTCRRYCEAHGLSVVGEFQDVESGLHIDRPAYQQALNMARAGGFDKLVVWRLDRAGRDDAEFAGMLRDFARLGIELASASGESPDPFSQRLAGLLAWDESRRISLRVRGSVMQRQTQGKWTGPAPFGYITADAPGGGRMLAPHEHEGPLVSEMFTRYATGRHSLADLQRFLREHGCAKSRASINYMLRSVTYLGIVQSGKFSRTPFGSKPATAQTEGQHAPLVDQETFDLVQARLSTHQHRQRGGPAPRYLFSGLIHCGLCGKKFVGRHSAKRTGTAGWVEYRCNRRKGFGDCASPGVHEGRLRAAVIPPIEKLLREFKSEDVRAAARAKLERQEAERREVTQQAHAGFAEQLARLERRMRNWLDMVGDGELSREEYARLRAETEPVMEGLRAQLADQPAPAPAVDLDTLCALADSITIETLDDKDWRTLIEGMVDRITIEGERDGMKKGQGVINVAWKPEYAPHIERASGEG